MSTPPPVPPVADAPRVQTATITSSTAAIDLQFPLYGDGGDLEVWIDGVKLDTSLWTVVSKSGTALSIITQPVTDGQIQFSPALTTGDVIIDGVWRPRRVSQPTSPGVTRRELNQTVSNIISSQREQYDAVERSIRAIPSESMLPLPALATRANNILAFDDNGNPIVSPPGTISSSSQITFIADGTGVVGRTAQDKMRDVISVKDFGAVGNSNGTAGSGHDDTAAIQAAMDYAAVAPQAVFIDFPYGVYRITAPLVGNVANGFYLLRGRGYGSKIFLDSATNARALSFDPAAAPATSLQPCVIIEGLNFVKPTTATSSANVAISIANNPKAIVRDCWFDEFYSGIVATDCYGMKVVRNTFYQINSVAIFSPSGDSTFNAGLIDGNSVFLCGLTTSDAAVTIGSSNGGLIISNNNLESNFAAFLFTGTNDGVVFASNYMENQTSFDVYFNGTNRGWTIQGNRIGSSLSVSYANLTQSRFINNVIGGIAGTIQFDPATSTGNYIADNRVEAGCTFLANDGSGTNTARYSGVLSLVNALGVASGGTGANLSATGGAHQVLKQSTAGGAVTVAQLATSDISGIAAVAASGSASDLSTGTLPSGRLTGSYTGVTGVGTLTAGTWQATKIGLAYGGTNADLSATGGTSQVLKQASVGGAVTVGQLAQADISGLTTSDSPSFAALKVSSTQVVGARDTGWTAMTGTGNKGALAAAAAGTASGTYTQSELQGALNRIAALEARLKSYDAALVAHGLIGT